MKEKTKKKKVKSPKGILTPKRPGEIETVVVDSAGEYSLKDASGKNKKDGNKKVSFSAFR